MMKVLKGKILTGKQTVEGFLLIKDDKILNIQNNIENISKKEIEYYDYSSSFIVPGFIDMHLHGGWGYDFLDGETSGINKVSKKLLEHGVTGFLPTFSCSSMEKLLNSIRITREFIGREEGAEILGIHLEGPFINKEFSGGLNSSYIIDPDKDILNKILKAADGKIKKITIAPEVKGSKDIIDLLRENNIIISAGHSAASYEEIEDATGNGLSSITHLFNAMVPLHHREPGIIGAALLSDSLNAEIIVDGIHIRPEIIKIAFSLKKAKGISLVSDSIKATGLDDGNYESGGLRVKITSGIPRLENGKLAGSTLTLDKAVRNIVDFGISNMRESIIMASKSPSRVLGLNNKGCIKKGNNADLAVLNKALEVMATFVDGNLLFKA